MPDILLEYRDAAGNRRLPIDAKYKLYDQGKLDPGDVYQTFFYAYAYARQADRDNDDVRAFILYPATQGGTGTRLRVQQEAGIRTARITALGIDVEKALQAIEGRQVRGIAGLQPLLQLWHAA